jgi:hypothetical protein
MAVVRYDSNGSVQWEYRGSPGETPTGIALDALGRVTLAGRGGGAAFVIRFGSTATPEWIRASPLSGWQEEPLLVSDSAGSVWLAVSPPEVIHWGPDGQETWRTPLPPEPTPLNIVALSAGARRVFVARLSFSPYQYRLTCLDGAGNVAWEAAPTAAVGNTKIPYALEALPSGGLAVVGTSFDGASRKVWLALYGPNGDLAWERLYEHISGAFNYASDMALGPDSSLSVSGLVSNPATNTADLAIARFSSSGALLWTAKEPAAPLDDYFTRPVADGDGGVFIASLHGEWPGVLMRYSATGAVRWTRPIPKLFAWAGHPSGGVVGHGRSFESVSDGALVERYDEDGSRLWSRLYCPNPGCHEYAERIATDAAGAVLAASYSSTNVASLLKYDPNGNLEWTQHPEGRPVEMVTDETNAIYTSWTLDPNVVLAKYSSAGQRLWTRTWPAPSGTFAHLKSMARDDALNLVLAGRISRAPLAERPYDSFTLKFDRNGNLLWTRVWDGGGDDYVSVASTDGSGNVVVAGHAEDVGFPGIRTTSFDPLGNQRWTRFHRIGLLAADTYHPDPALGVDSEGSVTLATITQSGTDADGAVLRYDRQGTLVWISPFAGDPPGEDYPWLLTMGPDGSAVVAGTTWSNQTLTDAVVLRFPGLSVPPVRYHTLTPCRLLDTREAAPGSSPRPLAAGVARTTRASGACGVPTTARALALNVTVTGATAPGHLRVFAGGLQPPSASTANYLPGQTRANNAIVGLGAGGQLGVMASQASGTLDVILDVSGYFE